MQTQHPVSFRCLYWQIVRTSNVMADTKILRPHSRENLMECSSSCGKCELDGENIALDFLGWRGYKRHCSNHQGLSRPRWCGSHHLGLVDPAKEESREGRWSEGGCQRLFLVRARQSYDVQSSLTIYPGNLVAHSTSLRSRNTCRRLGLGKLQWPMVRCFTSVIYFAPVILYSLNPVNIVNGRV